MKFPANAMTIGDRRVFFWGARRYWCIQFYDDEGNLTDTTTVAATLTEALEVENPCSRNSSSPQ